MSWSRAAGHAVYCSGFGACQERVQGVLDPRLTAPYMEHTQNDPALPLSKKTFLGLGMMQCAHYSCTLSCLPHRDDNQDNQPKDGRVSVEAGNKGQAWFQFDLILSATLIPVFLHLALALTPPWL